MSMYVWQPPGHDSHFRVPSCSGSHGVPPAAYDLYKSWTSPCVWLSTSLATGIPSATVASAYNSGATSDAQKRGPNGSTPAATCSVDSTLTSRISSVRLYCMATGLGGPQFRGSSGSGHRQNCDPCADASCVRLLIPGLAPA